MALRAGPLPGRRAGGGRPELGWVAVPVGYAVAAIPFSNLAARLTRGVDLRQVGNGTVSGTALYQVAGFGPLAAAGVLEVAKGAVGPLLAGRRHPRAAAASACASVIGHDWSPLLAGAGGRGLSPAIGALGVTAPVGAALILAGMSAGRLAGETAVGALVADMAAVPVAARVHGADAALAAGAVVLPMLVKRLAGNRRAPRRSWSVYAWRLLFDRDSPRRLDPAAGR